MRTFLLMKQAHYKCITITVTLMNPVHLHIQREKRVGTQGDDLGVAFELDQDCVGKKCSAGHVMVDLVLFMSLQHNQCSLPLRLVRKTVYLL